MDKLEFAKQKSIQSYLEERGLKFRSSGSKSFCSSPFSDDSSPSFCVYPTNTYYDWSTGKYGDIIALVQELEGLSFSEALDHIVGSSYTSIPKAVTEKAKHEVKEFNFDKYTTGSESDKILIDEYAHSRGITEGYDYGKIFFKENNLWKYALYLTFLHTNYEGEVSGAKFRAINSTSKDRFTARGTLGFYILENIIPKTFEPITVYLVESETSANSLWMYLRKLKVSSVVISFGGVSSAPKKIPDKYKDLTTKLIIDYDGNEELYNKRLKLYSHLDVEPTKLILDKGEDINSLYQKGKIELINYIIK